MGTHGPGLDRYGPRGREHHHHHPRPNARLVPGDCEAAKDVLASARVTLLQQEVPRETNEARLALRGFVIVNPAPYAPRSTRLPTEVDIVVPNRTDLAALLGLAPTALSDTERSLGRLAHCAEQTPCSSRWARRRPTGRRRSGCAHQAVPRRRGGPNWRGRLLPRCPGLRPGGRRDAGTGSVFATAAAALSTTRPGSQSGLPTRDEVERILAAHR